MKKYTVSCTMSYTDGQEFIKKMMNLLHEGDKLHLELVDFMTMRVTFTYRAEDDHMLFAWLGIEHPEVFNHPEAQVSWEDVGEDPGPSFGFEGFFK